LDPQDGRRPEIRPFESIRDFETENGRERAAQRLSRLIKRGQTNPTIESPK